VVGVILMIVCEITVEVAMKTETCLNWESISIHKTCMHLHDVECREQGLGGSHHSKASNKLLSTLFYFSSLSFLS